MNAPLLGVVAVAYLWVGYGYIMQGRYGMAIAFGAYALANLGFILDLRK